MVCRLLTIHTYLHHTGTEPQQSKMPKPHILFLIHSVQNCKWKKKPTLLSCGRTQTVSLLLSAHPLYPCCLAAWPHTVVPRAHCCCQAALSLSRLQLSCPETWTPQHLHCQKRKDYAFRHQFDEKPSFTPGCPVPTVAILTCQDMLQHVNMLTYSQCWNAHKKKEHGAHCE